MDDTFELLLYIENFEKETGSNFCMTKHITKSLGFAASHAVAYSKNTQGESNSLMQDFIDMQASGLSDFTLELDRDAQILHQLGVGIICNDVPYIPFKEVYNQ